MKIIFLDIDGVLNVIPQGHDEFGAVFHCEFVNNLEKIILLTGAKIVISSSWRKSGLVVMQQMWQKRGLPGQVIDTTPSLYVFKGTDNIRFWNSKLDQKKTPRIKGYSIPRGSEIDYWLKNEAENICTEIESYVILDDDTDMLYEQKENFVQCSGNQNHQGNIEGYGLTNENTIKAIEILNKNN